MGANIRRIFIQKVQWDIKITCMRRAGVTTGKTFSACQNPDAVSTICIVGGTFHQKVRCFTSLVFKGLHYISLEYLPPPTRTGNNSLSDSINALRSVPDTSWKQNYIHRHLKIQGNDSNINMALWPVFRTKIRRITPENYQGKCLHTNTAGKGVMNWEITLRLF